MSYDYEEFLKIVGRLAIQAGFCTKGHNSLVQYVANNIKAIDWAEVAIEETHLWEQETGEEYPGGGPMESHLAEEKYNGDFDLSTLCEYVTIGDKDYWIGDLESFSLKQRRD